jgi:hypothetical protein
MGLKSQPKAPESLAAAVALKIEAARIRLSEIEEQLGSAVLNASLNEPGADKVLSGLNARLENARRDVAQLESAHLVAVRRDAQSFAAFEMQVRRAELKNLQALADERHAAMVEMCEALAVASKAKARLLGLTNKMAQGWPTGLLRYVVNWQFLDVMIGGTAFPASIDNVIAAEMWRLGSTGEDGARQHLPGAKPLTEGLRLQPDAAGTAAEAVKRMNDYILSLIAAALDNAAFARSA